jgi:hypothetical protein
MSFVDTLPDEYQFTKQDMEKHWELFPKCVTPDGPLPTVTEQELEFYSVTDEADRLSRILKRMPTMGELRHYWQQEAEEQARVRAKIEADWEERKLRAVQKSI